jgi:predicted metal-dependent hydrolase
VVASRPNGELRYTVRRSRRARYSRVTIEREGAVVVTLPARAPAWAADELVAAKLGWITRHLERAQRERALLDARPELGAGRAILLGGVAHEVRLEPLPGTVQSRVVHDDRPGPSLRIRLAPGDERPLRELLEPWLRSRAHAAIDRRLALHVPVVGVEPARVTVRDQRSRWGSASRNGSLSFSWRLVLAPASVLDAIVVHELAHLVVFDHSRRFWRLVDRLTPHAPAARRWLRDHEWELRAALD